MLCRRFIKLCDLIKEKSLDLEPAFRGEQSKFQEAFMEMHRELTNWELKNVGVQTFSKAFEPLIDNIFMRKSKNFGLKKNTLPGMMRQAES